MRLSHILSIVKNSGLNESLPVQSPRTQGQPVIWNNLRAFRKAAIELQGVPGLKAAVDNLLRTSVFSNDLDSFAPSEPDFTGRVYTLRDAFSATQELAETLASSPNEESIVIKLPQQDNYGSIVSDLKEIQDALEQVLLHPSIGGALKLRSWETGSFWLHLYLGSALAVVVVGSIAWAAAVIRNKRLQGDLLLRQLEAWDVKNDLNQHVAEKAKQALDAAIDTEALAIYEKHATGTHDPEQVLRIKRSIKMLSDLVHRGAEVHPSLMAPEQASNLFPNFSALDGIASRIPQLADQEVRKDKEA